MNSKRFRIAFSFAGEKRAFVEKIAAILAKRFGEPAILYDKFHTAEFAMDDLVAHLTKLYRDESDLIVAVLCPDYDNKEWCGLEWKTIRGLLKQRKGRQIMLTRFGRVEPESLEGLAGYVELDHETPKSAATFILERLALNENNAKDHYMQNAGGTRSISRAKCTERRPNPFKTAGALPYDHPTYLTRMSDTEFEQLLRSGERLISITGEFGIGKSSLMQQAQLILPDHQFFGGGLADMHSEDAGRFMKNFFQLFSRQFGIISSWNELEEQSRRYPSIIFLDDLSEVSAPGLEALIPPLVERLSRKGAGLSAVATSPKGLQAVFKKRELENPKYAKPWKNVIVGPCTMEEADPLFALLPLRSRAIVKKHLRSIELKSRSAPQRLQCLCSRLFDGESNGFPQHRLSALIDVESSYE